MAAKLEMPIFGPASAHAAVQAGASRLELNAENSYAAGGLTPSITDLAQLQSLDVPVRIMVRPCGPPPAPARDFIYSDGQLDTMEQSILQFKDSGLMKAARGDGFVVGVLLLDMTDEDDTKVAVDIVNCTRLVNAARPYKVVFHRAFDDIVGHQEGADSHWKMALQHLVTCGFDGVLTSGGPGNAIRNIDTLKRIIDMATSDIEVIVGGGVRSKKVKDLVDQLALARNSGWVHSSCLTSSTTDEVDLAEVDSIVTKLA